MGAAQRATAPQLSAVDSRMRFRMLALISAGTMINYLDRTVLGVAAPQMTSALHLSPAVMGIVFSAFSWSYAAAQAPGGWLLDRVGTRLTYYLAVTLWSGFTLAQGFASGVVSLITFRLGLGVSEAPCFPANSRVVGTWFRKEERAKATAVYTVGEYLGLACSGPTLFWLANRFGWRTLFFLVGAAGIGFGALWWILYREAEHPDHAAGWSDGGRLAWPQVRRLLRSRQVWGASLGQFGGNSTLVFFLTWFPTYVANERHIPWIRAGFFVILPFLAAAVGVLLGGWASDRLLQATGSLNLARKLPIVAGLFGVSTIMLANYVRGDLPVIAIFSFAFFCQGMTGLGWTVISDIAPKELAGITGGIFNFAANLAGVITPIVIGEIISLTGSFFYALAYVGAAALFGALCYVFLLGDIERIVLE